MPRPKIMKAHGLGRVEYPLHQSYSQLCSAPLCLVAVMLHAPREAETGPLMLCHSTATMKAAQGPHSLQHLCFSCKAAGTGTCPCAGRWPHRTVERALSTASSPHTRPCDAQAPNQHTAFLTDNQCCGSVDFWFCCVNPHG